MNICTFSSSSSSTAFLWRAIFSWEQFERHKTDWGKHFTCSYLQQSASSVFFLTLWLLALLNPQSYILSHITKYTVNANTTLTFTCSVLVTTQEQEIYFVQFLTHKNNLYLCLTFHSLKKNIKNKNTHTQQKTHYAFLFIVIQKYVVDVSVCSQYWRFVPGRTDSKKRHTYKSLQFQQGRSVCAALLILPQRQTVNTNFIQVTAELHNCCRQLKHRLNTVLFEIKISTQQYLHFIPQEIMLFGFFSQQKVK